MNPQDTERDPSSVEALTSTAGDSAEDRSISGRYYGEMASPDAGNYGLELRVDVDTRHASSPAMNRVSGDMYHLFSFQWFGPPVTWRTYRDSWIVDAPEVTWGDASVTITGTVGYWKGGHPATNVEIVMPRDGAGVGPARVAFTEMGSDVSLYVCDKQSDEFREVVLEVDVCQSANIEPLLPVYDTHAHPDRPGGLPRRTLSIEEAYREAGIDLVISPTHTIVDDSAPEFRTWSAAELHDAMEHYFSQYPGTWPKWRIWSLLASSFDNTAVGGVMFDVAAAFGGAGMPSERQGCAIFRGHQWFRDLAEQPDSEAQAAAARKFLYTYVHEIGHAFNLLHSWDKGRPDSRSWMNYDWRYDRRNGAGRFWDDFGFEFDDDELIHLRHGDRSAVIMGADPWGAGTHLEAPPGAMAEVVGEPPVELLLRSKNYFQFMEPVLVEFRVRNVCEFPLEVDTQLDPEFGGMLVYVRRPDGRIMSYAPVLCKVATPELRVLKGTAEVVEGEDRHSQSVFLSYGRYGYIFDAPGEYLVRAVYLGMGDLMIPSNLHRIRVGHPHSRDQERIAQDYFSYETGMALYLGGSSSPYLQKGMDSLATVSDQLTDGPVGAHASLVLGQNLSRPFFRIEDAKVVQARPAEPEAALKLTAKALAQQKRDNTTFTNLTYHQLRRSRADLMVQMEAPEEARKELQLLVRDLKRQGVNPPVLDEIRSYAKNL